jgi:hypothetical protein
MSTTQTAPCFPGKFLAGYFLFFLALLASLLGSVEFSRQAAAAPPLVFVGVALALICLGTFLMAEAKPVDRSQFSFLIVCMLMTPLPFLIGLGINYLGLALRRSSAGVFQAVLFGVGVFLLALVALWIEQGVPLGRTDRGIREIGWIFVLDFGLVALLLASVPLFWKKSAIPAVSAALPE